MNLFRKASPSLPQALADLEQAVRDRDPQRTEDAFSATYSGLQQASQAEAADAGPRLAALLAGFPPTGPRGVLAVMTGACIERGADAAACVDAVLGAVGETVRDALVFVLAWRNTGGGDLPDPDADQLDDAVVGRVAGELGGDMRSAHRAAIAWWTLPQWEMASVAVLSPAGARRRVAPELRQGLIADVEKLRELEAGDFKCLYYALLVLDDEEVVVLHRDSGAGFRVRMSGLGDNFQLHTLLAHALIGGGHLPGEAPAPDVVALSLAGPMTQNTRALATGAFNLMSPYGEWIWNEGTPSDIPVVDGVRLLVLDRPAYVRSWNAGRFFPGMAGELELLGVLGADEADHWFQFVKPAAGPA